MDPMMLSDPRLLKRERREGMWPAERGQALRQGSPEWMRPITPTMRRSRLSNLLGLGSHLKQGDGTQPPAGYEESVK